MGADQFVSTTGSQENYDGMVGLTPVPLRQDSKLLVDELYDQGRIPNRMFSTFLNNLDHQSYIYFGDYEPNKIKSELIWMQMPDIYFWYIDYKGVAIEGQDFVNVEYEYSAIIDTGTTMMYFPNMYLKEIQAAWTQVDGCQFDSQSGYVICECNSEDQRS